MKRIIIGAVVVLALVVGAMVLAISGSKPLTDNEYLWICRAYASGQSIGRGPATALDFAMNSYHLSRADAADAVATARREYCP